MKPPPRSDPEIERLRSLLLHEVPARDAAAPVVIIGGAARTGTTLLQAMLCATGRTNPVIAEAAPLRFLLDAHRMSSNHMRVHKAAYFASGEELDAVIRAAVVALCEHLRVRYACTSLVLKEPELTKSFATLARLLPEALFVCMVRDPRDVVVSMLDWGERSRARGNEHLFQQRDADALAEFVMTYYRALLRAPVADLDGRLCFVRYEDLVREPLATARALAAWSGIDLRGFAAEGSWSHCALDLDAETSPIRDALAELYGQAVSDRRIGAFRGVLTTDEIIGIERKCQRLMHVFGYATQ